MNSLNEALFGLIGKFSATRRIEPLQPDDGELYERGQRILLHRQNEMEDGISKILEPHRLVYVHRLYVEMPSFEDINSIAADVVQNLRQSLDHAACACARACGKTDNGTYFPLVENPCELESRIKDQARKLPESIKEIIRRSEPGGGILYELHKLGLSDKHRSICEFSCCAIPYLQHLSAGPNWLAAGLGDDEWDTINQCLNFALSGSPDELDYKFEFTTQVRFNTGGSISSKPAIIALDEIRQKTEAVIGEMEREMTRLLSYG